MTKLEYERLSLIDLSNVEAGLEELFVKESINKNYYTLINLAAYVLYKIQQYPSKDFTEYFQFQEILNTNENNAEYLDYPIWSIIADSGERKDLWKLLISERNKFSQDELAAYILFGKKDEIEYPTPDSVSALAYQLLDGSSIISMADFSLLTSNFAISAFCNYNDSKTEIFPIDIYETAIIQAQMDVLSLDIEMEGNFIPDKKYDGIFFQFLIERSRFRDYQAEINFGVKSDCDINKLPIEWRISEVLLDLLTPCGKLAITVNAKCLSSSKHAEGRKFFVENGYIEKVIILPEKLYPNGRQQIALIILSKGNKNIHLIDARSNAKHRRVSGKTLDIISHNDIEALCKPEAGICVSSETICNTEYRLDVLKYDNKCIDFSNVKTTPIKNMSGTIFRGFQIPLQDIESDIDSEYEIIMPGDIHAGILWRTERTCITEAAAKNLQKFRLYDGDILITRNAYTGTKTPFKIAVFEDDGHGIKYANGGFFIIRLLNTKDSYFLKAFLESEIGQKLLERKSNGDQRRVISKYELEKIQIPYPDYDIRNEISCKSREICKAILNSLNTLESNRLEFNHFFNNKGEIIK